MCVCIIRVKIMIRHVCDNESGVSVSDWIGRESEKYMVKMGDLTMMEI